MLPSQQEASTTSLNKFKEKGRPIQGVLNLEWQIYRGHCRMEIIPCFTLWYLPKISRNWESVFLPVGCARYGYSLWVSKCDFPSSIMLLSTMFSARCAILIRACWLWIEQRVAFFKCLGYIGDCRSEPCINSQTANDCMQQRLPLDSLQ